MARLSAAIQQLSSTSVKSDKPEKHFQEVVDVHFLTPATGTTSEKASDEKKDNHSNHKEPKEDDGNHPGRVRSIVAANWAKMSVEKVPCWFIQLSSFRDRLQFYHSFRFAI